MYQKDYVLFLIEQVARLLRRIVARIFNKDFKDASFLIEQIYRQHLGINSDLINSFSYKYLMDLQKVNPEQYHDRCLILGEVLAVEARAFLENDVPREAAARALKSLNVFLHLFVEDTTEADTDRMDDFFQYLPKVPALADMLAELGVQPPEDTRARLLVFYERYGAELKEAQEGLEGDAILSSPFGMEE